MLAWIQYPPWLKPEIIPGLPVRWYGLMYIVAFAVAYLLFTRQLKERGIEGKKDLVIDMFVWAIVGLLVGGRLAAVFIYDWGYYKDHLAQIILPFSRSAGGNVVYTGLAGMSYHGGLVGATVAIITFLMLKKVDVLEWGDMLVAGIPLGYTFGRLGNFINGELYGRITTAPWGMLFPGAERLSVAEHPWAASYAAAAGVPGPVNGLVNLPRHPSQLYEAFFEGIVLWLILWFIVRRRRPYKGFTIAAYFLGYAVFRFLIEYTRQPDPIGPGGHGFPVILQPLADYVQTVSLVNLSTGQILNLLMIAAAVVMMVVFGRRAARAAAAASAPPAAPSARALRRKARRS